MRNILKAILLLIVLLAFIYIIYLVAVKKAEAPAAPTSNFEGPPAGSVPYVQGPTEPPPGY